MDVLDRIGIPSGLSPLGQRAGEKIIEHVTMVLARPVRTDGAGLYSASQWRQRGELYAREAELVVIHDGGDFAPFFNYSYEQWDLTESMRKHLETIGVYPEQCTSWYTGIYRG